MRLGNRFYEYGVIGAFFFISQLCAFLILLQHPMADVQNFVSQFGASLHPLPPELLSSLAAFIGALLLISIFLAGVLIDLTGSANRDVEVLIFCEQLGKNRPWLDDFETVHATHIESEYQNLASNGAEVIREGGFFSWRVLFRAERAAFTFWSKRGRAELQALRERGRKLRPLYRSLKRDSQRVYNYLVAFVVVAAGDGKPELLNEQLSIWRIVRGVSTVLAILAIEILFVIFVELPAERVVSVVVFYALYFGLFLSSRWMTRAAYSRVCETLFSLVKLYSGKPLQKGARTE